jgi:hypothetical protein
MPPSTMIGSSHFGLSKTKEQSSWPIAANNFILFVLFFMNKKTKRNLKEQNNYESY